MASSLFEARWRGECSTCGEVWKPGDMIGYDDDDELVCEDCHPGDDY